MVPQSEASSHATLKEWDRTRRLETLLQLRREACKPKSCHRADCRLDVPEVGFRRITLRRDLGFHELRTREPEG
jgi:hypothetical protein